MILMKTLEEIHLALKKCSSCPEMCGTPVHGLANQVDILLIGQAPGPHEADRGKPFAHTAGKTLFNWLHQVSGYSEEELREKVYFAAVARCFPGKHKNGGGDREPSLSEIENCRKFLKAEVSVLKPRLIIAVGKLAISEVLGPTIFKKSLPLTSVIGKQFFVEFHGHKVVVVPLPHPSGISTWHKKSPGKELLESSLKLLGEIL
jgi:uracil-DNA glycosylase